MHLRKTSKGGGVSFSIYVADFGRQDFRFFHSAHNTGWGQRPFGIFPKIRPYQDTCVGHLSQFFWCFNTATSIIVRWKISSSSLLTNILYSPLPPSPNSQYCSLYTFFHKTRQQHTTRMIVNTNKDDHKNEHGWSKIQTRMITNSNKEYHKYKQGISQIQTRMITNIKKDVHKYKKGWSQIQTRMITNAKRDDHKLKKGWSQIQTSIAHY